MIPTIVGSLDVVPTTVGWYGYAPSEEVVAERLYTAGGRLYIFMGEARVYSLDAEERSYLYTAEGRSYVLYAEERMYELYAEGRMYVFPTRSNDNMPISGFNKYPSESFAITINFANRLPTGRSLQQTNSVVSAIDENDGSDKSSTVLSGYDPPTVFGTTATVVVQAGASGDRYELRFEIALDSEGPIEERLRMEVL